MKRYLLLDRHKENAIFQVTGKLTYLSVTLAVAVKHRKQNAKVDEYSARLRIEKKGRFDRNRRRKKSCSLVAEKDEEGVPKHSC